MSIEQNTTSLQSILEAVNALPEAGNYEGSGDIIKVSTLPSQTEASIGKVYKLTDSGELYAFLAASQFSAFDIVPTIASNAEADEIIGQLMGYDTCHTLFTAKLNHSGEEFSCIVYTNSDYDPYSGYISSMQGSGDYGYGYNQMYCSAAQLAEGGLTFSDLVTNAGLSYVYDGGGYDATDTITITSITPLGEQLFDFSTGGTVNITTGKMI